MLFLIPNAELFSLLEKQEKYVRIDVTFSHTVYILVKRL